MSARARPRRQEREARTPSALADDLARVLAGEPGGLSWRELTRRAGRRPADVGAALRADPRFRHAGRGRGSRWSLAGKRSGKRVDAPRGTGWGDHPPRDFPGFLGL
jgi:hypothetical protein